MKGKTMKKLLSMLAITGCLLASNSALAQPHEGFMLGLKAGHLDVDLAVAESDIAYGLLIGYGFGNGLAIEFEANSADGDLSRNLGDYDFSSSALYLAGHLYGSGPAYLKIKGGYFESSNEARDPLGNKYNYDEEDSGFSFGLGGGYNFGAVSLEAEYTKLETNYNLFSIGANYNF